VPSLARSYLYVPGDRRDRMAKAAGRGADALILDLEDGVAPAARDEARRSVADFLATEAPEGPQWWVRINGDTLEEDLVAVTGPRLSGVFVPGADRKRLHRVHENLCRAERVAGLPVGSVQVIALVETAAAVLRVEEIARAPRVLRLGLGEADLAGELRLQPGWDRQELWPIRSAVVVASAAAGIAAPVGPVETSINDAELLAETSRIQLRQGFRARTAIHPAQIATIHAVFTPGPEELAQARAVLDAWAEAERAGSGVAVGPGGRMLDAAVVRAAREVVARAE
jgi:citrate lyase subunit beta/citryl-CoA lyase